MCVSWLRGAASQAAGSRIVSTHVPMSRDAACTRYAVEENHRIALFVELAAGSVAGAAMGELMYQSHYAYTECGLGSEATDLLVELVRERGPERGLYGAKITGGGAGGTVAVLARRGAAEAFGPAINAHRHDRVLLAIAVFGAIENRPRSRRTPAARRCVRRRAPRALHPAG